MRRLIGGILLVVALPAAGGRGLAEWQSARRAAAVAPPGPRAESWARWVAGADGLAVGRDLDPARGPEAVPSAGWTFQLAALLRNARPEGPHRCLCAGWRTVTLFHGGVRLGSIAAIHGHQLRIDRPEGGGDFTVDAPTWSGVEALLRAAE